MSDYCLIVIKTSRGNCVLSSMQRLAGATLLVFANKQDLPGALSKEAIREVRLSINLHYMVIADLSSCQITVVVYQWQTQCVCFLQALALDKIKTHHWCIIGCSAVTGENLLDGVDWLLDDIAARIFTADWATLLLLMWWADMIPGSSLDWRIIQSNNCSVSSAAVSHMQRSVLSDHSSHSCFYVKWFNVYFVTNKSCSLHHVVHQVVSWFVPHLSVFE